MERFSFFFSVQNSELWLVYSSSSCSYPTTPFFERGVVLPTSRPQGYHRNWIILRVEFESLSLRMTTV